MDNNFRFTHTCFEAECQRASLHCRLTCVKPSSPRCVGLVNKLAITGKVPRLTPCKSQYYSVHSSVECAFFNILNTSLCADKARRKNEVAWLTWYWSAFQHEQFKAIISSHITCLPESADCNDLNIQRQRFGCNIRFLILRKFRAPATSIRA